MEEIQKPSESQNCNTYADYHVSHTVINFYS